MRWIGYRTVEIHRPFTITLTRRGTFGIHDAFGITSSSCRSASPAPVSTTVSLSLLLPRQRGELSLHEGDGLQRLAETGVVAEETPQMADRR